MRRRRHLKRQREDLARRTKSLACQEGNNFVHGAILTVRYRLPEADIHVDVTMCDFSHLIIRYAHEPVTTRQIHRLN